MLTKSIGPSEELAGPPLLSVADAIGISLLSVVMLAIGYFRSLHCMFWGDEIMGALTLGQPTWHELVKFWHTGIDSSGIWYYVLARPWITVFSLSEVSLRLFSAVGMCASAALIWISARRFYTVLPVAASVALLYLSSTSLRWQLSNGRTYGVFMTAAALVLYMIFRGEDEAQQRPTPPFLCGTFAAYAFLAGSHILGALYVGSFLGIQLLLDVVKRRFRPWLYLAATCSLSVVVFSRENLAATAALGKPTFWTIRPSGHWLIHFTIILDPRVKEVILTLFLMVLFSFCFRAKRTAAYVVIAGFLAIDLAIFIISKHMTPIYVDRYMMPFALGAVLFLCEILTQIREGQGLRYAPLRSAFPLVVLWLALSAASHRDPAEPWLPYPNYTDNFLSRLPPNLPIVDTDVGSFVEIHYYHPALVEPLIYPTDWPLALDPHNYAGVSGLHEMDNFKKVGIFANSIQPTAEVLRLTQDFLIVGMHSPEPNLWIERRLAIDPRRQITHLFLYQDGHNYFDVWKVHTVL